MSETPIVAAQNLTKLFPVARGLFGSQGAVVAVDDASFEIGRGEIVALVGESGSGKSTLGRIVQGLLDPTAGALTIDGRPDHSLSRRERAGLVQMVFQDPFASLNPKLAVGTMLSEAVRQGLSVRAEPSGRAEVSRGVNELLRAVGLPENIWNDYPHQFSGGQRQRLGIARALALKPRLIIADEPVSALDLSIQAQILNLLMDLNESQGISFLLISHDLSVVQKLAERVLVLQNGRIVEQGRTEQIFQRPVEAYTRQLLSAIPAFSV